MFKKSNTVVKKASTERTQIKNDNNKFNKNNLEDNPEEEKDGFENNALTTLKKKTKPPTKTMKMLEQQR